MTLFHIVDRVAWQAAAAIGEYRPASLAEDGFVHCSFAGQVAAVANARYRDAPGLCVVELDPGRLGCEVRVEDSYREGRAFPHVYGPLPATAAVAVHCLRRDASGKWAFTAGAGTDPASPDR